MGILLSVVTGLAFSEAASGTDVSCLWGSSLPSLGKLSSRVRVG